MFSKHLIFMGAWVKRGARTIPTKLHKVRWLLFKPRKAVHHFWSLNSYRLIWKRWSTCFLGLSLNSLCSQISIKTPSTSTINTLTAMNKLLQTLQMSSIEFRLMSAIPTPVASLSSYKFVPQRATGVYLRFWRLSRASFNGRVWRQVLTKAMQYFD